MSKSLSRRNFNLLAGNVFLASVALPQMASAATQFNLGHFSSANPQTYAKVTGSLGKDLGGKAEVNFVAMPAAPQFLAALAGGSIDTCAIGSSPMVTAFSQGLDVSLVYIQKVITNAEALVVRKNAGVKSVADLKGKRIGVPFNTSAHFALTGVLKKAGLRQSDVCWCRPESAERCRSLVDNSREMCRGSTCAFGASKGVRSTA